MIRHGIELDSQRIRQFCRKWGIRGLYVFGSVLRDDFSPTSDVDFMADFGDNPGWDLLDHQDMERELAEIVGRKVDIVSRYAVQTCPNRYRRAAILSSAEPVYAAR